MHIALDLAGSLEPVRRQLPRDPWDSGFNAAQFLTTTLGTSPLQHRRTHGFGTQPHPPSVMTGACMLRVRGRVLLSRRAVPPRIGFWTIPGGFVEKGETTEKAAVRELAEETGVCIEQVQLAAIYTIPQIRQTCFLYSADLSACEVSIGAESSEARLFNPLDIPWNELAFPTDRRLLHQMRLTPHALPFDTGSFHWGTDGRIVLTARSRH
jgi:ADP-ribose pyrophosphatase YjhB (NUDIX family)